VLTDTSYDTLVELIADRATTSPFLVGIAGSVAVGKTTAVRAVAQALEARGRSVQILSTDAFLLPNAVMNDRGILMRKGFPESYDHGAIETALTGLRSGAPVTVPIYSHDVYDIVPGSHQTVTPTDLVLVEGVIALQEPIVHHLDLAVYIEAAEAHIREWYVQRFLQLTEAGATDAASFYHRFSGVPVAQLRQLAEGTWANINVPNLHDYISPSAVHADIVVTKAADHSIAKLRTIQRHAT
jgi:type I pantothenate kinase